MPPLLDVYPRRSTSLGQGKRKHPRARALHVPPKLHLPPGRRPLKLPHKPSRKPSCAPRLTSPMHPSSSHIVRARLGWLEAKLGWLQKKLGWLQMKLSWLQTKLGWLQKKLGWLQMKLSWLQTKLGWLQTKLGWPQARQGCFLARLGCLELHPHICRLGLDIETVPAEVERLRLKLLRLVRILTAFQLLSAALPPHTFSPPRRRRRRVSPDGTVRLGRHAARERNTSCSERGTTTRQGVRRAVPSLACPSLHVEEWQPPSRQAGASRSSLLAAVASLRHQPARLEP